MAEKSASHGQIDRTRIDAMPEAELRDALRAALAEADKALVAADHSQEAFKTLLMEANAIEDKADLCARLLDMLAEHWKSRPGDWRNSEDWRRTRDLLIEEGRI